MLVWFIRLLTNYYKFVVVFLAYDQCLFGHLRCSDNENGSKQSCSVVFSQQYIVHFRASGVEYDPLFHSRQW